MNAAHRLTRAIRAGTVWVNTFDRSSLTTPFGGFKQSGFGRDRSPHAIDKYMDYKTIWTAYNNRTSSCPHPSRRSLARPRRSITAIEITRHRLHFDPPFHASWDTKPRTFWDAAIVQVHTDLGVTGFGSGDMMLGFEGHEHLFVGQDALAIERHWRILNNISFHWGRCWPLDLALWDLAGKITGQPCWKLIGGLSEPRQRLCLVRHAARPGSARRRGRALSRARVSAR